MNRCLLVDGPNHGRVLYFVSTPYEIDAVPGPEETRFIADPVYQFGPHRHVYYRDGELIGLHQQSTTYKFVGTL